MNLIKVKDMRVVFGLLSSGSTFVFVGHITILASTLASIYHVLVYRGLIMNSDDGGNIYL